LRAIGFQGFFASSGIAQTVAVEASWKRHAASRGVDSVRHCDSQPPFGWRSRRRAAQAPHMGSSDRAHSVPRPALGGGMLALLRVRGVARLLASAGSSTARPARFAERAPGSLHCWSASEPGAATSRAVPQRGAASGRPDRWPTRSAAQKVKSAKVEKHDSGDNMSL
jgi:hypothetical protein